jgi:hypothetical protein
MALGKEEKKEPTDQQKSEARPEEKFSDKPVIPENLPSKLGDDVKPSDEPVQSNPSSVIGEQVEVSKDPNRVVLTRMEYMRLVSDIVHRYSSDSQAASKALKEIDAITPIDSPYI